jgi:miniconductance mechanosensitive channel|tara:strand:+ start:76 stop:1329 length:1254 start_codon:yes stop_codon:yes gene_type:complete
MKELSQILHEYLMEIGMTDENTLILYVLILSLISLVGLYVIDFICKKIIRVVFIRFAKKSKSRFDDILITNRTPRYIAHLIPFSISLFIIPFIFNEFTAISDLLIRVNKMILVLVIVFILRSLIYTVRDYFKTLPKLKDKPIDSYIQVIMMFIWAFSVVSLLALITGRSFMEFITTIGAASAIIILVFKDTIMGFVASIQVSVNDMVRIGDWITFQKYGADGDVIEINLATVKVQNFDMTITTIPTYALISDSFKNWRGMVSSEGRRIKRSININFDSIKFLNKEDIQKLSKIEIISSYVNDRRNDIDGFNSKNNVDKDLLLNGRNLTNIGVFRKYLQTYIETHSAINKDMTIMVRQLDPTIHGVPLEVYAFSSDKEWQNYEYIISDIFDHIISSVKYFDLHIFEMPSSVSIKNLKL